MDQKKILAGIEKIPINDAFTDKVVGFYVVQSDPKM